MNLRKIVFFAIVLIVAVSALSFVSANEKVTVCGVDFSIPDGYEQTHKEDMPGYLEYTYTNEQYHSDQIVLHVAKMDRNLTSVYKDSDVFEPTSIGGHDGYVGPRGQDILFAYQAGGKVAEVTAKDETTIALVIS